jgi:hypothetical protein
MASSGLTGSARLAASSRAERLSCSARVASCARRDVSASVSLVISAACPAACWSAACAAFAAAAACSRSAAEPARAAARSSLELLQSCCSGTRCHADQVATRWCIEPGGFGGRGDGRGDPGVRRLLALTASARRWSSSAVIWS